MDIEQEIQRGDIWMVNLGHGLGSEHSGHKYCLVVQNDVGNKYSGTTVVIPITKEKKGMPTHVVIRNVLPKTSYIMCEQIRVIDKSRLNHFVTQIDDVDMNRVSKRIKFQLGIEE